MRHEKAGLLLDLARRLAASAEGLTLDEMAAAVGVGRRTVERMRDALASLFPNLEEVEDPPSKRFRIVGGLDGLFQNPTTEELVELGKAAEALRRLESKIRSAMRGAALRRLGPDVEALMRAETIAVQAGPRPFEDEALIGAIRAAIMAMKAIELRYDGGSRPGERRVVTPFGTAKGDAAMDRTTGPSAALPSSLKVTVTQADAANPLGLSNDGWWGIAVRPNTIYTGSVYAKTSAAMSARVSLVADATGKVLASTTVPGVNGDWKQYKFSLKTGVDVVASPANHLLVTFDKPGRRGCSWFRCFRRPTPIARTATAWT